MVRDKDGKLIAYAEVKGRYRTIANCYPLPVAARKVVKLCDKRLNPVMIWACDDGIVYGQPSQIEGSVKWGGRKPREGAVNVLLLGEGDCGVDGDCEGSLKCWQRSSYLYEVPGIETIHLKDQHMISQPAVPP